ncbi:MAG TPA: DUF4185 domain-containing protein, partial [Acidimicrobiales bacterium]|nr:DUF4185 domain-containing protein [Acidimicrobiales bacterium]
GQPSGRSRARDRRGGGDRAGLGLQDPGGQQVDAGRLRLAVVLRTAAQLTGPWSSEQVVATAADYPELYAPYLVPVETGRDIYFTMSQYGPYEVYLMQARLP